MKTYNFMINENGGFQKTKEIYLSQNEHGGVRFVFTLPAFWDGMKVSLEYYAKKVPDMRIRTSSLYRTDGKHFYDITSAFTAETGPVVMQLVGERDGKVVKTLLKASPEIKVIPSVNAVVTAPPVYTDGTGESTTVDLSDILARLDALESADGSGGGSGADFSALLAALEAKADKSDLTAKADIMNVYTKSETQSLINSGMAGAVRSEVLWEGMASSSSTPNTKMTIPVSADYNKYTAYELYFRGSMQTIYAKASKVGSCVIAESYVDSGDVRFSILYVNVYPDRVELCNAYLFYYDGGEMFIDTDTVTLTKIKGIY